MGAGVMHGAPVISNMVSAIKQLYAMHPDLYVSMASEQSYQAGTVDMMVASPVGHHLQALP